MKILVYEDCPVLIEILRLFKYLEENGQGPFELMVAVSVTEAKARLPHVDLAILDVTNHKSILREQAPQDVGIPVIGLTIFEEDEGKHQPNGPEIMYKLDPGFYKKLGQIVCRHNARRIVTDESMRTLHSLSFSGYINN